MILWVKAAGSSEGMAHIAKESARRSSYNGSMEAIPKKKKIKEMGHKQLLL